LSLSPPKSNERFVDLLPGMALFLNDFHTYNLFKINSNEANAFLKSRTNRNGDVDRQIILRIYFRIINFSSAEYKNLIQWEYY